MGLLDGLGRHLGGAFAPLFEAAVLHRVGADGVADEPVRARLDGAREASEEPGLPGRLVRAVVLTPGLLPPNPDDEITLAGTRHRIVAVETDPAGSHATIQGRPL